MKTISKYELIKMMENLSEAEIIRLDSMTKPRLKKTDNPFDVDRVLKIESQTCIINCVYGNIVNNRRLKEFLPNNFVPQSRIWGQRILGTPLVTHNNKFYLEVLPIKVLHTQYRYNGNLMPTSTIKPYLFNKQEPTNQGIDNVVSLRVFEIDNIRSIKIRNEEYQII